jgi:hypothetical protein
MKTLLLSLVIVLSCSIATQQLYAQTFIPITASPPYMGVTVSCTGGGNTYILYTLGNNITADNYLYRFDGTDFYLVDTISLRPMHHTYCMTYDNNELYIGGGFDSVNDFKSPGLVKYSLSTDTFTKSSDIIPGSISGMEVFDIKKWNNQFLMSGMFYIGGLYTPLIKGSNTTWSVFDNAVYRNGTICTRSNRIEKLLVENDNRFYISGAVKYIDQLEVNEVAMWDNGQWQALGTGLPYDNLYGWKYSIVKQFGKVFVAHEDSALETRISYFDGNNWNLLHSPVGQPERLLSHSCGLFNLSTTITPNYLGIYNEQLAYSTLTGVTVLGYHHMFELNGSVYLAGNFSVNAQLKKLGRIDCTPLAIVDNDSRELESPYPNPFSPQLTVSLSNNEAATIILYDYLGQQVLQQIFTNSTIINTEQMQNGIYFYELRNDKGTLKTGKLVKQ